MVYNGILLTKVTNSKSDTETENSIKRILYINNSTGDSLALYVIESNAVSSAVHYDLKDSKNDTYFYIHPIFSDQEAADSMRIRFSDIDNSILINDDHYILYPKFYNQLKLQVKTAHSVMALLSFLEDNIGDYPITEALPLLSYDPEDRMDKRIKEAKIITARSQSDEIKDTWDSRFHYNSFDKLDSIQAVQHKEIGFSKDINYKGQKVMTVRTHRNIEDRQITDQIITYPVTNKSLLKLSEHVIEPGKDRETILSITFKKQALSHIKAMDMSQAEVLSLIK